MNVFDIVGPIMIGPSSSHTAGAARIGKLARQLFGGTITEAEIKLHGSFAKTYQGHGTARALVGGILGMNPDDEQIRDSLMIAEKKGLKVTIFPTSIEDAHPNTAVITLKDDNGKTVVVQGASTGGGNILISRINGLEVEITGQYDTLIIEHHDEPGVVGDVAEYMGDFEINLCSMKLSRTKRGGTAVLTVEVDGRVDSNLSKNIESLHGVTKCTLLKVF
ncbi:MAG: L-serine ammonia-lyase, iron-sulfur-dependent subunit beta [Lachnospiraceae bacterium]